MRYVSIRLKQKREDAAYRNYIADGLYASLQKGLYLQKRYEDIINPDRNVIDEDRSSDEIIDTIKSKLKGMRA